MKQIAGRAGRYGTVYENGIVATLQEGDKIFLHKCLIQKDLPVQAASVFPSVQQLELLGALLDNSVTSSDQLEGFWSDYFEEQFESSGIYIDFSTEDMYRPEFVLTHFSSTYDFSLHLKRHLRSIANSPIKHKERPNKERRKKQKRAHSARNTGEFDRDMFPRTPLSVLLGVFKDDVSFPRSREKASIGHSTEYKSSVKRSLYFVGDLEEKRRVAELVEQVYANFSSRKRSIPLNLSFRDKYMFSLAPVDVDNTEVVSALKAMVGRYLLVLAKRSQIEHLDDCNDLIVQIPKKYLQLSR